MLPKNGWWGDRKQKHKIREVFVSKSKKTIKGMLILPSKTAEDLKLFLEKNRHQIDENSKIYCFERNPDIFKDMKKAVKALANQYDISEGNIEFSCDEIYNFDFESNEVNLIFLDLNGVFDYNMVMFLRKLFLHQKEGVNFSIVLSKALRGSNSETFQGLCKEHLLLQKKEREEVYNFIKDKVRIYEKDFQLDYAHILLKIFSGIKITMCFNSYIDTVPMYYFNILTEFKNGSCFNFWTKEWDLFLEKFKMKETSKETKKRRHDAAVKAWQTRRENEIDKKLIIEEKESEEPAITDKKATTIEIDISKCSDAVKNHLFLIEKKKKEIEKANFELFKLEKMLEISVKEGKSL